MQNVPTAQEHERSAILDIVSYDLAVDLTGGAATFSSRTEIRFLSKHPGSASFADLQAFSVRRVTLNGADLDIDRTYHPGRLELPQLASENTLVVEADFSYTSAETGLHRVTGPGGSTCVYSKVYPGGAPRIFCCFDQPGLRAPFTVAVNAPAGWSCLANGPVTSQPEDGDTTWWKFATTHPIAPVNASVCAGPFSGPAFTCQRDPHLPLPVTVNALPSAAALLETTVSPELVRQPLAYYEHGLSAYPYDKCDFIFVPAYPKRAGSAPGLVIIRDTVLAEAQADETGLSLAIVIAHELAHEWFGGLIDLCRRDDGWLIEPLTTYISRTALEEIHPGITPWAPAVSQALPDHAYAPDAATIRQLEELIGRQAVLTGLSELLRRHAHSCATKDDLVRYWSQASGTNLRSWATEMLASSRPSPSASCTKE
jgi:aminopeptidase N